MDLSVRPITRDEHLGFIASRTSASFLQCPAWGQVKREWRHESVGWVDPDGKIVGTGLVLYRQVPRVRRFLAYLPEGPLIDWYTPDLKAWLQPMLAHLKARKAFGVRMGPPVATRRWTADTIKRAIAGNGGGAGGVNGAATRGAGHGGASRGRVTRLPELPPDREDPTATTVAERLSELGWIPPASTAGFAVGQPRYVFQVPLADRSLDDVFAGFNQLWRRNIRRAEKAGVEVTQGSYDDLPAFHGLYVRTAERDRFTPRPLWYFQTMFQALRSEDPDRIRLYLARHEGELLAATIWVRVGSHAWYSYGASSEHKRDVRPSNAIQWRMLRDAHEAGATVYDLRGITETLDPNDHLFGLIQFKLGTGGEAVEYLGEWDYPINPVLFKAFRVYLRRRG
jgi:lipid II:glycine glycyltransferase (peptidoglycan interpeptide bridge formation enzyme)